MKVQFRLAKKRWSVYVELTFTRVLCLVILAKADANQVVQFILPLLD